MNGHCELSKSFAYVERYIFVKNPNYYLMADENQVNKILHDEKMKKEFNNWNIENFIKSVFINREIPKKVSISTLQKLRIRTIYSLAHLPLKEFCEIEILYIQYLYYSVIKKITNVSICLLKNLVPLLLVDNRYINYLGDVYEIEEESIIFKINKTDVFFNYRYLINNNIEIFDKNENIQFSDLMFNSVLHKTSVERKENKQQDALFYLTNYYSPYMNEFLGRFGNENNVINIIKRLLIFLHEDTNTNICDIMNEFWRDSHINNFSNYRNSFSDVLEIKLGTCSDTALITSALLSKLNIKNYVVVLRGVKGGHSICIAPDQDILISNFKVCKATDLWNKDNLYYVLSYFHIDSIQIKNDIYYDDDILYSKEIMPLLKYFESVVGERFYFYNNSIKKSISYHGVQKLQNDELCNHDCAYVVYLAGDNKDNYCYIYVFISRNSFFDRNNISSEIKNMACGKYEIDYSNMQNFKPSFTICINEKLKNDITIIIKNDGKIVETHIVSYLSFS